MKHYDISKRLKIFIESNKHGRVETIISETENENYLFGCLIEAINGKSILGLDIDDLDDFFSDVHTKIYGLTFDYVASIFTISHHQDKCNNKVTLFMSSKI